MPSCVPAPVTDHGGWVDRVLLAGADDEPCLGFGAPVGRAELRALVAGAQERLTRAGLEPGGTVALRLAPSVDFVAMLLAAWRIGGQAALLDHRLTPAETGRALDRLGSQVLVEAGAASGARAGNRALRGYSDAEAVATARPDGRPAATGHALIQLSSGSTGPSKVIGRTADDLIAELDRYARLPEFPKRGNRIVLLSSMVHVLGLVGGLLHALHAGARLVLPERLTPAGILATVTAEPADEPTTLIGVPFYAELLAGTADPPPTPNLVRMIVAGELVRPGVPEAFTTRYGVPLGTMYGMTELGVIATDLTGRLRPAVAPVYGMDLREDGGELHIRKPASPYLGDTDPARWSDGWLHTRDAAHLDPATGQATILGRRDSQVSIGGLKVDLTEVEQTLAATKGVAQAVVVFDDGAIEAYIVLEPDGSVDSTRAALARELAAYKLPRRVWALAELPRTATGKIVRAVKVLRAARLASGPGTPHDPSAASTSDARPATITPAAPEALPTAEARPAQHSRTAAEATHEEPQRPGHEPGRTRSGGHDRPDPTTGPHSGPGRPSEENPCGSRCATSSSARYAE